MTIGPGIPGETMEAYSEGFDCGLTGTIGVTIDGQGVPDDIMNRNQEMQTMARSYYWNAVTDLTIHLKAVK